jgi:hypothetical protein
MLYGISDTGMLGEFRQKIEQLIQPKADRAADKTSAFMVYLVRMISGLSVKEILALFRRCGFSISEGGIGGTFRWAVFLRSARCQTSQPR